MGPDEFEAMLRQIGAERYHNRHRFHRRLHDGGCSLDEVRAWALNRYYYQSMIPIKDATVLSRMEDPALRRQWRERIIDHDGSRDGEGGIDKWLKLTGSLGFRRDYVVSTQGILPATRFAVEAYVTFCAKRTLLEAIASSLTELFSPQIIGERVSGMLAHYRFVNEATLAYFTARPVQARRDSDFALDYVKASARTPVEQGAVLAALTFKCDVLWAQLDALWSAYVEGAVPPGAWQPGEGLVEAVPSGAEAEPKPPALDPAAKPRLPRGVRLKHDEVRNEWVLLAPERLLKLNPVSVEILRRCTGEAGLAEIVDDLSASFNAPRARIAADVEAMLSELVRKRLVDL